MKRRFKVYGNEEANIADDAEWSLRRSLITSREGHKYCYGSSDCRVYEVTIKVKEVGKS